MGVLKNPIFIGGSGRCGTSMLFSLIENNTECYGFTERETKFIIGADGLIDLYYALTHNYNESRAVEAIRRFKYLMNNLKTGKIFYEKEGLETFFFTEKEYDKIVDEFVSSLYVINEIPAYKAIEEVLHSFKSFLNIFFGNLKTASLKKRFVEKTPHNFLHLKFLNQLFLDLKFIHITRNPRGVAYSLTQQNWAPSNYKEACLWLLQIYESYINQEDFTKFSMPNLYLQIKLEDFCTNYEKEKERIKLFLNLEIWPLAKKLSNVKHIPNIEMVNYWENKITKEQWEISDNILGKYINYFDYY